MTAHHWYRDGEGGSWVEVTDRIATAGWELKEQAEEGSTPISTIDLADVDMDLTVEGLRSFYTTEDTSESDDNLLFYGYTTDPEVSRGQDETLQLYARAWNVPVSDRNGYWERVVMRGADCNRSAETDVERMTWLLNTSEAATFDDTASFFSTASPVNMDPVDYRGQKVGDVVRDCAEAGGKNWWAKIIYDGADQNMTIWYAKDSSDAYDSLLLLSNDPTDLNEDTMLDGTSVIWPVSEDTKVVFDHSRVACGIYAQYDGGATYRHNATTHTNYGHRDKVVPMPNVKSLAKAQARADRMLNDTDSPEQRCTTRVRLPAAKATMLRSGMRTQVKLTHVPGWEDWLLCRVLVCSVKAVAAGSFYDLTLELVPTGPGDGLSPPGGGEFAGAVFAGIQGSTDDNAAGTGRGNLVYGSPYHVAGAGWDDQPDTGPASTNAPDGSGFYHGVTVSQAMTVRIYCRALCTNNGGFSPVLNVLVNGAVVGSATTSAQFNTYLKVDLRNYSLSAGDVVTVESSPVNLFWTNSGVNGTQLIVGRGTFVLVDIVGEGTNFIGP